MNGWRAFQREIIPLEMYWLNPERLVSNFHPHIGSDLLSFFECYRKWRHQGFPGLENSDSLHWFIVANICRQCVFIGRMPGIGGVLFNEFTREELEERWKGSWIRDVWFRLSLIIELFTCEVDIMWVWWNPPYVFHPPHRPLHWWPQWRSSQV